MIKQVVRILCNDFATCSKVHAASFEPPQKERLVDFIYEQYLHLPGYLRLAFRFLYFLAYLRAFSWKNRGHWIGNWKNSRLVPLREFVSYHRTLIAFYLYSREEER